MGPVTLAGDIGGTKAHLILVEEGGDPRQPLYEARIPAVGSASCEDLLAQFLAGAPVKPRFIGLGIPGPVKNGRVKPTNLMWEADEDLVAKAVGAERAVFVNDLVATALGVPLLRPDEQVVIAPGEPDLGPIAVVAPGTGLGEAFIERIGPRWKAHGSEAGHADFAPRGPRQRAIQAAVEAELGQVNLEAVCSGRGLPVLWRALASTGLQDADAARILSAPDPSPAIMTAAESPERNPCAAAAAEELSLILAQEAGNAAVRWLATGGVALAGGIPPRILPWLQRPAVVEAFRRNRALGSLLQRIPLSVVLNPGTAVLGAWAAARQA
jgi:glucokinase